MAQTCQGDLPTTGMAQLYVEVAPEQHAPVKLVYAAVLGANGRLILAGRAGCACVSLRRSLSLAPRPIIRPEWTMPLRPTT